MSCNCQSSSLDLGTPASRSSETVSFSIDGQTVTAAAGTTIIRAAAEAGIKIPKLCATEQLNSFGSCRLCLVQVEGRRGYPASCTTPVEAGMKIVTQSQKLADIRKGVMELYISDHPLDCLTCTANGNCELQDMAGVVGLREVRYGMAGDNHFDAQHAEPKDESNPYFSFEPSKCIVCSRCVRACEEVQGTFALTISGRGFDSKVSASASESFLGSECVSCGACVNACPTATLSEKTLIQLGQAERSVTTTCAYCGVGCSFNAEIKGQQVVRMVPDKNGGANAGHACVKGRFAWGYATHPDRVTKPMIRKSIHDAWQEVSWDEAVTYAASEFKRIQAQYGRKSVGGITSSRCSNEESYLVQKLVRTAFGNNNVDTCARVCHSPTGYGLKQTLGESAGTQDFESVMHADVVIVMGANPTEGHPVFGSMLKRRLREGAKLIVIDPREIEIVRAPHIDAAYHLALTPGTNVAMINALAQVIVSEGLMDEDFVKTRCEQPAFAQWREFILRPENSPEAVSVVTGVPTEAIRGAARLYASAPNGAIYYGLGVTEHSQGSTTVMGIANLAMLTGNIGRAGVGVNPLRGQNNVQGSCDMGSFPHELPGYRHVSNDAVRNEFSAYWKAELDPEPGYRIPNMMNAAIAGTFRGMYIQGEDIAQSDPNTKHIQAALGNLECLVIQDIFFNETAKYAHVFLPGASFLEKDGTFTNAERRISRIRKVMDPLGGKSDWEGTVMLANALGVPMHYNHPSEIMDEIAALTPTFTGVSYKKLDQLGSIQWPCNAEHPEGYKIMHTETFTRGLGQFILTEYVPTTEKITARFPLILTTGRILSQYNVGAQTRRTNNVVWHSEDKLEIHRQDAEDRGINEGDWVLIASRAGETRMRVEISNRVQPGVVYTTFHFPESGANVVTTDNSDWATNCPEYKVTAVQVARCEDVTAWQQAFAQMEAEQQALLP
ncbi:MAG: formate dehydrogenase subunit alpha [Thiolinea sp.]